MCNGTDEGIVQYGEEPDALTQIFIIFKQCSKAGDLLLFRRLNADVDSQPFAIHFVPQPPPDQVIGKRKS